jgi:signal transduction histidine kinase
LRHNLRNGLTVILGRARLLADTDPEAREAHAETIVSSATNLQRLTSYTKDLSDMIGAHHVPQHRQNVSDLLGKAVNQLIETYPETEFDLDVSRDPFVMATAKLDLAIEHVLTNAIEHNDADSPHVAITVRPPPTDDGYVEITVADNGPGIPKQEREVLLEGDEEPLKHGSGLGLWIVNWIITRSGGYIEFDANDPCGSRVTLNLPPEQ